jgi:hypothetical protein
MKNPLLPEVPARVFKRSHISNPETWTSKKNFEQCQIILALLKESIKDTCYENAESDQLVFYVSGCGTLLGDTILSLDTVKDSKKGITYSKKGNSIFANIEDKIYLCDYTSWRELRKRKDENEL